MEEIWKSIPGYEGLYEVSNMGRVKSFPRKGTSKNKRIKALTPNKDGYLLVALYKNGKRKRSSNTKVSSTSLYI